MNSYPSDHHSRNNIYHRIKGRWTENEHRQFLQGLAIHGKDWSKLEKFLKTRTSAQIRSHAQKFFKKITQEYKRRVCFESPKTQEIDYSLNNRNNLDDFNFLEGKDLKKQGKYKMEKMEVLLSMEKIKRSKSFFKKSVIIFFTRC